MDMKKVLIIEDDSIIGNIYRGRLTKQGYDVELVSDGQTGITRIHAAQPDYVLLDLMLPKVNGVDLLKQIRAVPRFQEMPIIVFTNAYVPKMVEEAYAAGATAVFSKATLTPRQIIDVLANPDNAVAYAPPAGAVATPKLDAAELPSPSVNGSQCKTRKLSRPPGPPGAATGGGTSDPGRGFPDDPDRAFRAELFKTFRGMAPETLASIRASLQAFNRAESEADRLPRLLELYRTVHALTGSAGFAGVHQLSKMTAALEVLLKQLYDRPKNIDESTLRTVISAIDLIGEMLQKGIDPQWDATSPIHILVVDDEVLSRRALIHALELVRLKADSVENPHEALALARTKSYDLILLDALMPGMDGFELCTRIHAEPKNNATPTIFVTAMADFTSRARSTLSGGADLIGKPFLFIELGVKALTYVMRAQLAKHCEQCHAA